MKLWIMVGTLQIVHSTSTSSLAILSPWRGGGELPPPEFICSMCFSGQWHSLPTALEGKRVTRGFRSLVYPIPPPNTCYFETEVFMPGASVGQRGSAALMLSWELPIMSRWHHGFKSLDIGCCSWNLMFKYQVLHCVGYRSLVGSGVHSWGWDLGRASAYHGGEGMHPPLSWHTLLLIFLHRKAIPQT